jgi:glycosyltransferase involved in cell wall biosynthesis
MMDGKTDGGSGRVLFMAMYLVPNDARFLKMRDRLVAEGFDVSAIVPRIEDVDAAPGVVVVQPGPLSRLVSALRNLPMLGTLASAWLARRRKRGLVAGAVQARPDVIIGFDPEAMPAAMEAKAQTGARFIYDAHEYHSAEDPSHPERGEWVARLESRLGPHLDGFVTVNKSIASLYARDGRITLPALVVRNSVDPFAAHDGVDRLRPALGVPADEKVLLYHGALRPMRGLTDLADLSLVLPSGWTIGIMGEGAMRAEIEARANPVHLRFIPPVPHRDLPLWLPSATLGAVLYEGVGENQINCTPNKLWEYAAAGVPILARDLPELAAAVRETGMGLLVSKGETATDIAGQLEDVDAAWLSQASRAAHRFAQGNDWGREVEPLVDLVRDLVETT